jgi:hypothetical protein
VFFADFFRDDDGILAQARNENGVNDRALTVTIPAAGAVGQILW